MGDERAARMNRAHGPVDPRYDVIVVGAGVGGLVCAALAARHGKKVLVLDHHYVAGGNATLFRRGDFHFDVGLHYVGDCHPGGLVPRLLEGCGAGGVRFLPMDPELEHARFPGFEITIPRDRREFERRLLARYPAEARGIRRYFRFLEQVDRLIAAGAGGSTWQRLWNVARAPLAIRYASRSLGELLDGCTRDPELRAVLTLQHGTYAVAPGRVSALLHAGLVNHYFRSGGFYPEGGGQAMSDALVAAIESNGGPVRLRASVDRIDVEGGRAVGVTFTRKRQGTQTVRADAVVSNADLLRTVHELVGADRFPPEFVARLAGFEMALPLFVVFLGLDLPPSELGYGNANQWLCDRLDVDAEYAAYARGEMLMPPPIYVSTASLKDPDNPLVAPAGCSNVEVMAVAPSDPSFWGVTSEEIADGSYAKNPRYLEVKERLTQACIDQYARIVPSVREHLVHVEAATPMSHSRFVRSTGGTSYGLAALPSQFLRHRPGARSPLPGLYFCGASCRAGHGIVGAMTSGAQAAGAIVGRAAVAPLLAPSRGIAGEGSDRLRGACVGARGTLD